MNTLIWAVPFFWCLILTVICSFLAFHAYRTYHTFREMGTELTNLFNAIGQNLTAIDTSLKNHDVDLIELKNLAEDQLMTDLGKLEDEMEELKEQRQREYDDEKK